MNLNVFFLVKLTHLATKKKDCESNKGFFLGKKMVQSLHIWREKKVEIGRFRP
jgi:hypothetical protein